MDSTGVIRRHSLDFIHHHNQRRNVRRVVKAPNQELEVGRLPRITRLMALAIRFEHLIATGAVDDQVQLAELGHVTRARVTQIMNLLCLAPDIQEAILHLPRITSGKDAITERHIRPITSELYWVRQRALWARLASRLPA